MTQLPCPNCGESLTCGEEAVGRKIRCPRCRVLLRLDADAARRPAADWPRRGRALLLLLFVLLVFTAGLGIGFLLGYCASSPGPNGVNATAFGFFSASNNIVVTDPPAPPLVKPAPAAPPARH